MVLSTPSGYCIGGLETFRPLLSLLPLASWFFCGFATYNSQEVPPLLCINCLPSKLLPYAYNSTFQHVGGNLLVYSISDSHHQRLVVIDLWQLVTWCFRSYPWSTPLLYAIKKCKDTNSKKYLTYITYPFLPSTLNTITVQHKIFESFNHIPLKSHTKYLHIFPFLPSLSKESFPYPTQLSIESFHLLPFLYPPSPHTTHKAHIDP